MCPAPNYDALLLVSFGGPERGEDVIPFLENVLRGRNVPRERMLEVAEHYQHFAGCSPLNEQNRSLIAALRAEMSRRKIDLPIHWGNRNWHPLLPDTMSRIVAAGHRRVLAFFTSAYSSYSGCRQYRENIEVARQDVGSAALVVDKIRVFFNHPGFIEPQVEAVQSALSHFPQPDDVELICTAHSIPLSMAEGCNYEAQLQETARLIAEQAGASQYELVYQSRSGPPQQPWLEPDICDYLHRRHGEGLRRAIMLPIGFLSDHMEVMFDLDIEAKQVCDELGIEMVRAATVGTHPRFIAMIADLIEERLNPSKPREAIGQYGPSHDICPPDCCQYHPKRPPTPADGEPSAPETTSSS